MAHPIPEACRLIGVKRSKRYDLIASGDVDARKIGGRTVITAASIHALIDAAPRVGGGAA